MRIGVISDTHGGLKCWQEVMNGIFSGVDLVIHAGDIFYHGIRNPQPEGYDTMTLAQEINDFQIPLIMCKGNCDSEVDQLVVDLPIQSPYIFCQFDELKILVHHGHLFTDEEMLRLASRWNFGICISGHTHIPRLEQKKNMVFLNPGSPALPKGDKVSTVALIETKVDERKMTKVTILDYQHDKVVKRILIPPTI
jgi:hypothetical protein